MWVYSWYELAIFQLLPAQLSTIYLMHVDKVAILGSETIRVGYRIQGTYCQTDPHYESLTYVIISDKNIFQTTAYSKLVQEFKAGLKEFRPESRLLLYNVSPGENNKSREPKPPLRTLLELGCTRDTVILAVRGGILWGLVSWQLRSWEVFSHSFLPLIGHGGFFRGWKTAIDDAIGKELNGSFHQPDYRFLWDVSFGESLPARQFINGMAEVVKTAAIWNETEFSETRKFLPAPSWRWSMLRI